MNNINSLVIYGSVIKKLNDTVSPSSDVDLIPLFKTLYNQLTITNSSINITYLNLIDLIRTCRLIPNTYYLITDYRTAHFIPQTTEANYGNVEPIYVFSMSTCKIAPIAFSSLHKNDILYYTPFNEINVRGCITSVSGFTSPATQSRGIILRRIDSYNNIDVNYDFRAVKYRRWESVDGSGIFDSLIDTTFSYEDNLTLPSFAGNVSIGNWSQLMDASVTSQVGFTVTSHGLPNIVIKGIAANDVKITNGYGITIDSGYCNTIAFDTVFNAYLKAATFTKISRGVNFKVTDIVHNSTFDEVLNTELSSLNSVTINSASNFSCTGNIYASTFHNIQDCTSTGDIHNSRIHKAQDVTFTDDINTFDVTNLNNVNFLGTAATINGNSIVNCTIDTGAFNLTLTEVYDCIFGEANATIELRFVSNCNFGDGCAQIHMFNTNYYTFGSDCKKIFKRAGKPIGGLGVPEPVVFGNDNSQIIIGEVFKNATIGNQNYNLNFEGGVTDVTIGDNVNSVYINQGCSDIVIESNCSNLRFDLECVNITCLDSSRNIKLNNNCENIVVPADSINLEFTLCTDLIFNNAIANPANTYFYNVNNKTFTGGNIFNFGVFTNVTENDSSVSYEKSLIGSTETWTATV